MGNLQEDVSGSEGQGRESSPTYVEYKCMVCNHIYVDIEPADICPDCYFKEATKLDIELGLEPEVK